MTKLQQQIKDNLIAWGVDKQTANEVSADLAASIQVDIPRIMKFIELERDLIGRTDIDVAHDLLKQDLVTVMPKEYIEKQKEGRSTRTIKEILKQKFKEIPVIKAILPIC